MMRTIRSLAILATAAAIAALAPAPSFAQVKDYHKLKYPELRPFTIPRPERIVLDNGMVVMLLENHELPLIEVMARVRTGSRYEPADKVGLAGMFGQLMRTGGTKTMTGDQIDDFLESRAAMVETNVGTESGSAGLSCLAKDFDETLKVFTDILRNPAFNEDKLKLAKTQATSQIARRNDDAQGIMQREFAKLVYGADSPYARSSEYATISNITRDDFLAFHAKYYRPERIILGVTGDFDSKEMKSKLMAAFGDWKKGDAGKDPEIGVQSALKPGIYFVPKEDMTQSNIIMGHIGIQKNNPDLYAVEVMNDAFSGGFAARLFSNVRSKKGLAYSVRGRVDSNYDYPGTFNAWMTTKVESTAAAIDALTYEIKDLTANPPSAEEVKSAKESILNSFVFNFDSPAKILRQQITYEYFGYPADYLDKYRQNIEKVTPADVERVARQYVHKDQMAILVVGPTKGQDRPLDSFGKVTKLDTTIPEAKTAASAPASPEAAAAGKAALSKIVEALGGGAAVDAVKAIHATFNTTMKGGDQGEMEVKADRLLVFPSRVHQEMTTARGKSVSVLNGADGSFMTGPRGTRPIPESRRVDIEKTVHRDPIFLAQHRNDPDLQVRTIGKETLDGAPADVLMVIYKGEETKTYVDPATARILGQAFKASTQAGPADIVAMFSDFRPTAGLVLPYKSVLTVNGEAQQTSVFNEITINPPVDESIFNYPTEPAPAPQGGK